MRTSAIKWVEGLVGGVKAGLSETEAERTPTRSQASLNAPVCSWRATAGYGVAVILSKISIAPGARMSNSPIQRTGSVRAGSVRAEDERTQMFTAAAEHAG